MSTKLTPSRGSSGTSLTNGRNPFSLLRQEMDDLMTRFWGGEQEGWFGGMLAPAADLVEGDNAFEIRMDAPGFETKDIDIQVQGNTVTLSGNKKEEKEEKGKTFHRVERRSGSFSRTFTLPCNVNEDEVAAEYTQGVLTVKLPKCDTTQKKKITVKG